MMNKLHFSALLLILSLSALACHATGKEIASFNDGWSFRLSDSKEWSAVSLPHTYNCDAYSSKNYYKGKAEYARNLKINELDKNKRYFLKFDAANKSADVSVNGNKLLTHNGGYSAFCVDITDRLRQGDNEINVIVDNSREDIPPVSADFTFWGGLYRDAWVITTPLQHFDICRNASSGVYATPYDISDRSASVRLKSRIVNDGNESARMTLHYSLKDADGNEVASKSQNVRLRPGETSEFETSVRDIENILLWSPDAPHLYSLTARLNDRSGNLIDETTIPVGFRWFSFNGADGFMLNGKPCKLRGVNRHQDLFPIGTALDDEAHRRDMRLIKDLGCNFVRLAHYQQDDAVLDECDRLGLIVWEEIPVVNIVPDAEGFDDNSENMLVDMIRQHYNHPSVMMWGYMNEILLKAPSADSPEWDDTRSRTTSLASRLERKLKEEDGTRASVMAFHGSDRYNDTGLALTDVQGWNLYQGWYGANLKDFEKYLEDQRSRFPERSLIVSEWGAGSDRRLHSAAPVPFDFSMEYQQKYIEHYLPYIEKSDYISGAAYWNFIDFNVAERQESMPRVNNKGIFYNDRTPKDVAYYFKSAWRDDIATVRLAVRDRDSFISPDGKAEIKVYSNCPEVELMIDGVSQGIRKTDNFNATFDVTLPFGESVLSARGARGTLEANDAAVVTMRPAPSLSAGETLSVNLGSDCDFTSAVNGRTWLADRPYRQGEWGHIDGKKRSTTSEIFNTPDTPLFQTMLEDMTEYRFDAPEGRYEVELLFTDINKKGDNSPYLLGRGSGDPEPGNPMRMAVEICGKTVDPDFSPAESAGYQQSVCRKYVVDNTDGEIDIRLIPLGGRTAVSAISVRKL